MNPIGNVIGGLVGKVWDAVREAPLKKLAWDLRDYADQERRKEPNAYAFPRAALANRLGKKAFRIREVLEFMEERKWAAKVRYPADCWQIN